MLVFIIIIVFALGGLCGIILISLLSLAGESDKSMEELYEREYCEENEAHKLYIFDHDSRNVKPSPDKIIVSPMEK